MTSTTLRVGRGSAALAALAATALLAACSTTVTGSGRPAAGGGFPSSSSSSSSSGSGDFSASGDAHDVWSNAIKASTPTDGTVRVRGVISGAGVSSAKIAAAFSTGDDGEQNAQVSIVVDEGTLEVTSTGGKAWAQSTAAVYEAYGYDDTASEQAAGKQVVVTDDDSGLDVYADLATFLSLCGPDPADPASLDEGRYEGKDVTVVNDDKYGTKTYVDPSSGHVLASVYEGETVTFAYSGDQSDVSAPAAADIVSVDGF